MLREITMLIQEMMKQPGDESDLNKELGFDLKDDLMCYMRNDPEFYRKEYYPVIRKFAKYSKSGKTVAPRAFKSLVDNAYEGYQNKFPVEGMAPELSNEMCEDICNEIHRSELEYIKNGHYDEK